MVEAPSKRLKCKIVGVNLIDLDFFSKSDPICMVEELVRGGEWTRRDQTEVIMNNLNPEFTKELEFEYTNTSQIMKFVMHDYDGGNAFELIGIKQFTV